MVTETKHFPAWETDSFVSQTALLFSKTVNPVQGSVCNLVPMHI